MSVSNEKSNPLQPLVGRELSAVVFVRDYVQFQFDGPTLTAVNDPIVLANRCTYQSPTPGYRDALCERIGHAVIAADFAEGEELRIELDDQSTIFISLRPHDYVHGPEAVIFHHGEDTWVW